MNKHSEPVPLTSDNSRHQPDRIEVSGILRVAGVLTVIVVSTMVGMVVFFRGLDGPDESIPSYAIRSSDLQPPPPRLDPAQPRQLRQLRAEHQRILSSYEWLDEKAGIARIPIDRAMELIIEEMPVRADHE